MQIIDAHCHFWKLDRGDYGWLDGVGGSLEPIRRDFAPADFPGTGNVIAVQAAPTLAETDYLLELSQTNPRIKGVVGWIDLTDALSISDLTERAQNLRFKGIRPMLQDIEDADWILQAPRKDVLVLLAKLGLRFDALVTTRHLPALRQFADQNPDLPIIIDHAAKPQPDDRAEWADGMRSLAANNAIYCKLSGLLTEFTHEQRNAPLSALKTIFAQLLDWFGPQRLVWGSDWPVLTLAASYQDWLHLTEQLLEGLSADEKAAIMHDNAVRFYGVTS